MKSTVLVFLILGLAVYVATSVKIPTTLDDSNNGFVPAAPIPGHIYKNMYILDSDDGIVINGTLLNIYNAYRDPRLAGNLEILFVVFGRGASVYYNSNPEYQPMLTSLAESGCTFALCNNTINALHLNLKDLFPGVNPVPSGNGEIILRLADGWTSVHP
ncbi:hypothetical protein CYY_010214 [Polysphondylium violaceum]|uniref:DsrE family protein n=1 Tax=Polysphondylium violaceum TaxID=133409 RepID=A0A8J4UU11_9MYCE|nr:hypothetical protein CYY_010214 [Polysphondylium violaceum]